MGITRRLHLPALLRLLPLAACLVAARGAQPVEFAFSVPKAEKVRNPFAREIWAEVALPSGKTILLPAFYEGQETYAVRARPSELGTYRLGTVSEALGNGPATRLDAKPVSPGEVAVSARERLPAIGRDPRDSHAFIRSDGRRFFPIGANVAWADGDAVPFYQGAIAAFARSHLNWMRVWMVHWSGLNLDWVPDWIGQSPPVGGIDPDVAKRWDQLIDAAESSGVYLQIVLQYHGQFTSGANSSWADNPWNAARPGGFLKKPEDFFTDPNAQLLTVLKYRYIVARWGWSPAVFAWELFNEVHWTDAYAHGQVAEVARWHAAMADAIRSLDVYGHLVTTSTQDLRSPIYAKMDFYQPHLYASNLIAGARSYDPPLEDLDKPVFYGEVGDDHLPIPEAAKKAGVADVVPMWAALMGEGVLPAQPWEGARLISGGRLGEAGAVLRFAALTPLLAHRHARPFSAAVETDKRTPLRIEAGQTWEKREAPEVSIPADGRQELGFADIPEILVGSPDSLAAGFPGHATFDVDFPRRSTVRVHVAGAGGAGSALRVSEDGKRVAEARWPAGSGDAGRGLPADLSFGVDAGRHTLLVENPGAPDWVDVPYVDLGLDTSVLASVGRRDESFIALWLWRRDGVFAVETPAAVTGTVVLEAVPAGTWTATWWNTAVGRPEGTSLIRHPGGVLRVPTPPIGRHAALVLVRAP